MCLQFHQTPPNQKLSYKHQAKPSQKNPNQNLFEPNLFKTVLSFAPLREYFETLNLMLGIVEDLNLDRRI
ncbi:MAG: DUF3137 domain-containing protein [Nostoc sp.]|uniref:DUF3137 domain-containing protein n=1 Tax=Nostoc sp. TaxID=1180 RepID=UPI002FEFFE81